MITNLEDLIASRLRQLAYDHAPQLSVTEVNIEYFKQLRSLLQSNDILPNKSR